MYHAPLAASQTHRWIPCPGSVPFLTQLREIVPEAPSEHADEGTYAHKVLDHQLHVMYKNVKPDTEMFNYKDQWAIDVAIEYVQDRMAFNPTATLFLENFVLPLPYEKDCGGTADIIILTQKELEIIDYKHGRGVYVSPHWNSQLLTYALGALELTDIKVERVKTTIVQPRHGEAIKNSPKQNGVMSETYPVEMITEKYRNQLIKGIDRVKVVTEKCDSPTYTMSKAYEEGFLSPGPGRKACRFCDLKALCPATQDGVTDAKTTFAEFKDMDISDTSLLSNDVIKKLYSLYLDAPHLKQIVSSIENMVLQLMELEDDERPALLDECLNLEKRYGHRAYTASQAQIIAAMIKAGVDKKKLFDVKLKTPSNMLALLPKGKRPVLESMIAKPVIGNKVVGK